MMAATLVGFSGVALRAQTPDLFALLPQWDSMFAVRAGGGYKDNVYLSHNSPQASGFVSGGGEVSVLRLAPDAPMLVFLASADANYYFSTENTEAVALAQGQLEEVFSETWKGSLALQYLFQDQIMDLSAVETNRQATLVRGHMLTLRPNVRHSLSGPFWLALETPVAGLFYAKPLDDSWETGPRLMAGYGYGAGSEVTLSYEAIARFYSSDPARESDGTPIPDSRRRRLLQELRLTWRHYWDEKRRLRTTVSVAGRLNEENGDYFDYVRASAAGRIEYRPKGWELSAGARVASYRYAYQEVSESDPSKRRRTEVGLEARLRRDLGPHLKLVASYEYEQTLSNDELETYNVNAVTASLQWEF